MHTSPRFLLIRSVTLAMLAATLLTACAAGPQRVANGSEVPLVVLAEKSNGVWCPKKVDSLVPEVCPPGLPSLPDDHRACRSHSETVRWLLFDKDSMTPIDAEFTISFDGQSPVEKKGFFGGQCSESEKGDLDCKVRKKAATGDYKYTVTIDGSANCPHDPRIYVNPTL